MEVNGLLGFNVAIQTVTDKASTDILLHCNARLLFSHSLILAATGFNGGSQQVDHKCHECEENEWRCLGVNVALKSLGVALELKA